MIGVKIPPDENLRLVKGEGKYVDDMKINNTLYLGIVRSPYPRALIKSVDISDASRISKLVITSKDLTTPIFKSMFMPAAVLPEAKMARMPILAINRVNFVGQPVAAVVCEDQYLLQDALELVSVDYEPLEPVLDPMKAMTDKASVIHPELDSNVCLYKIIGGNVDEIFDKAEVVLEDFLEVHRVAPAPMEPRATLAVYNDDTLTIYASSQGVFIFKQYLLENLAFPENRVRVVQTDVGGAFGSKTPPYPEHLLTAYASIILGRPVKWVETRRDNLTASNHSRDIRAKVSVAANKDGTVQGIKASIITDIGAYAFFVNTLFGIFTAQQVTGPYQIKAAQVDVTAVYTNKTPTGPYRGFSRPEAAFIYERAMDMLADELRLDPIEIRRINLVPLEKMPYKTPLGLELDPEDYHSILNKALALFNYEEIKKEVEVEKKKGRLIGVGVANYIELGRASFGRGEAGYAKLDRDGKIYILTGAGPHGQGLATVLRQIMAWEMEIPLEKTRFLTPDSNLMKTGVGTFGSRSTVISGEAVILAARALKQLVLEHASKLLEVPQSQLRYSKGYVVNLNNPSNSISLEQIAEVAGPLEAHVFAEGRDIFSYGVHIAVVEVDKESGAVKLLKYFCADDAGRVVNPLLAEGQIIGSVAQAIGQVFYEEMSYSEDGQPLNVTISDAGLPSSLEVGTAIESILFEYPSSYSHGARGIGEAGAIAGLPTLVRAVEDAVGKRIRSTNLKTEKIWTILNNGYRHG